MRCIRIPRAKLTNRSYIGEGSFANVSAADWHYAEGVDPVRVAVKHFYDYSVDEYVREESRAEKHALSLLPPHPNVVRIYGVVLSRDRFELVMELADTTLMAKLRAAGADLLPIIEQTEYALQVARGMLFLHCHGVVHRDLKSNNVLISEAGGKVRCIVADFGTAKRDPGRARVANRDAVLSRKIHGTTAWMSREAVKPELLVAEYVHKIDVWAFGCLLYELMTCKMPFNRYKSTDEAEAAITSGASPGPLPDKASPVLRGIMTDCMKLLPQERPGFGEVVRRLADLSDELDRRRRASNKRARSLSTSSSPSVTPRSSRRQRSEPPVTVVPAHIHHATEDLPRAVPAPQDPHPFNAVMAEGAINNLADLV